MSQPPAPFYGVLYTSANRLYTCSILGFGAFPSVALFLGYSTEASHSSSSLHLLQVIYFLLFFSHTQPAHVMENIATLSLLLTASSSRVTATLVMHRV